MYSQAATLTIPRGHTAQHGMGSHLHVCVQNADGALEDLRAAAKLAPADKGIRAALTQAKAQEKTSIDRQRAAYRRMMAPSKPEASEAGAPMDGFGG